MLKECKWNKKEITIISTVTGKDLLGKKYEPLFSYFESRKSKGNFVVIGAK